MKIYALILVVLLLGGCTKVALEPTQITIADASQPVFVLVYIADANNYFAEEGVHVNFESHSSGRDALTSVLEGRADLATVYETPVVLRSFEGHPIHVVSGIHESNRNTALVARANIKSVEDLRNKKIGVTKRTNGEFFLSLFLTSHGIALSEVNIIDLLPTEITTSLARGEVDAVATWNPHLYNAAQAVDDETIFYSQIYTEISVLAGTEEFVKNNDEPIKRVLKALTRAEQFLRENELESKNIVKRRLSETPETTIDATWDDFEASLQLDNVLLTIFEQEAEWMIDTNIVTGQIPDFETIILTDYLKEVHPEAVTLY